VLICLALQYNEFMNIDTAETRKKIETAMRQLTKYLGDDEQLGKPVLAHSLRVGSDLWAGGYGEDIVLAGFLHDIIEDSGVTAEQLDKSFGHNVSSIVELCTKKPSISDNLERRREVIKRAASTRESAIVKAADILDNYRYYSSMNLQKGIDYCRNNTSYMKEFLNDGIEDQILEDLFKLLK